MNSEHVREDLAGVHWIDRHLIHDRFDGCRMTGLEAPEVIAEHVVFTGCRLDLANFRHAKVRHTVFDDCVLDEADFTGADLSLTRFTGCSLAGTRFDGARLTKVDLRGSRLAPAGDARSLKGAIIDTGQLIDLAPLLARDLGIVIEDTEI